MLEYEFVSHYDALLCYRKSAQRVTNHAVSSRVVDHHLGLERIETIWELLLKLRQIAGVVVALPHINVAVNEFGGHSVSRVYVVIIGVEHKVLTLVSMVSSVSIALVGI